MNYYDDVQTERIAIEKASNGYMLTLYPKRETESPLGMVGTIFSAVREDDSGSDPLQRLNEGIKNSTKKIERKSPRTYVFIDIEKMMKAVGEFLLDGKMPEA